jgi:ATP-dependent exoDNAse (exonuclease V) beta subunit
VASDPIDDGPARDRIRAELGQTLFVDAGAGSGKTTALVGRIVELVRHGTSIGAVAAITFTEAAAAELRHRLRRDLRAAADNAGDLFEQDRFVTALAGLDGAAIQTLHAFAQRLLRQFPVEAGLPPAIEVADEISSIVRFTARWRAFRDEWEGDVAWHPALRRFLLIGGKGEQLSDLARVFNDHWDRLDGAGADASPPELSPIDLAAVTTPLAAALDLAQQCRAPEDTLAVHLDDTVAGCLHALEEAADDDQRVQLLRGLPRFTKGNAGTKGNWGDAKAEVVGLLAEAQAEREALVARLSGEVVAALAGRVAAFVVTSAGQRRSAGQLEFHDLLVLARDLLRGHPEARAALSASYRALLLDEFQDTDPIQLELAHLIGAGVDGDIEPGRLFFVGDPKQSIYRFRRADLAVYLDTRQRFQAGLCELSSNFRTVPGIVDWVNGVFEQLMAGTETSEQAPYLALAATREPLGDVHPAVLVTGGPLEVSAAEVRRLSAADLAALINTMVADGWPVQDPEGAGGQRPVRHDDICVLVPSRLAVSALEDAFGAAGLPYRLLTSSLVWASQEVREVLAVLGAVDDPGDEVALVAALRSPVFACSDADLAQWAAAGGRWSYLFTDDPDLPGDHPVRVALATLAELHQERWWLGPDGLIDRLLTEHGVLTFAAVAGRRRERWRRLRFLADQAHAFVESQHGDLTSFLEWIELQSSDVVRVSSPVLPEADDPAIRVMTIHGSKGLEFPVVALFGLGVTTQTRASQVLWAGDEPVVRLAKDLSSLGYNDVLTAEEQMDRAERIRLLYVGATRARDRLVVCTHHKATVNEVKNPALGALFEAAIEQLDPGLFHRWEPPVGDEAVARAAAGQPIPPRAEPAADVVAQAAADQAAWVADRAALIGSAERTVWSATAVAKAVHPDAVDTDAEADELADGATDAAVAWRRGRAGTAIGRAVHGTLQLVDLVTLDRLDAIARAQATVEGLDESQINLVAALARAGAGSDLIGDLVSRRHWREMYVAAPVEGVTVEGYVDLLAEDGSGGLVVVDYKTDAVRGPADVAERTDRYRLQAATYALALEAVTGFTVSRAVFLFLGRDGAVPADVVDLAGAKGEARAILAARGSVPAE